MALTYNFQTELNDSHTVPWIVEPTPIAVGASVLSEFVDRINQVLLVERGVL